MTQKEAEILSGEWVNPDAARVRFKEYAESWVAERPSLSPKTAQLYEGLLRRHLVPSFGSLAVGEIKEPHVRRWRRERLDAGVGAVTVAKAYRLLRAIMNTAVEDGLIRRNPCRIKRAGVEPTPERPAFTLSQVYALVDAIEPRYRALVLLATFASLRWGELAALRGRHLDLTAGVVRVEHAVVELKDGSRVVGPPKSLAGRRTVTLPGLIVPELRWHVERFAEPGPEGLVFVGPKGAPLRRTGFSRPWKKAIRAAGLSGVHFHDLRHTGNTLAATGAGLRELMVRMGHASSRAALIYQHATSDRDRLIADALGLLAEQHLREGKSGSTGRDEAQSGTQRRGGVLDGTRCARGCACDLDLCRGAGDGDRTRVVSLGS
ncbi:MAG: tyrosine-type recombinase/integrase [Nocardioidaceae bacterium]